MDTSMEYNNVLRKQKANIPVTYRDVAVSISNHEETLLKYMVDNDYNQVYRLLHESDSALVVGKNAGVIPSKARCEGELLLLLTKKDYSTLNQIISEFVINMNARNYTTDANIITKLREIGSIKTTAKGNQFTLKFNS